MQGVPSIKNKRGEEKEVKKICINCFSYEDPVEGSDNECPECGYLDMYSTEALVDMANAYKQCQEELKETTEYMKLLSNDE